MKSLSILVLSLLSLSAFAAGMGKFEGEKQGSHIDFNVLTYMRGINIDARFDADVDSRISALQTVQILPRQYKDLFESNKSIKDLKLLSIFTATASAEGDEASRVVTIREEYRSDGGVLVTEKVLTLTVSHGDIIKGKLVSKKRRGFLGAPLWMAKVFDKDMNFNRAEDGLLLRDDGADLCRVVDADVIEKAIASGNRQELTKLCDL